MHRRTASTALITLILLLNLSAAWALDVKITGYFPGGYKSKHQARIEGGPHDRYGRPLRTLQKYDGSYVSAATDPRIIKSGTIFYLNEFPNIKFLACDVGRGVKGYHIDIACQSEKHTYQLPKRAKIIKKEHFKIMNFREYQQEALKTANTDKLNWRDCLTNAALGLNGEAGEFADIVKKYLYQGHQLDKDKLAKELGDQLWYLSLASYALDVPLEDIAKTNIDKLRKRYPNGHFEAERSIKRED